MSCLRVFPMLSLAALSTCVLACGGAHKIPDPAQDAPSDAGPTDARSEASEPPLPPGDCADVGGFYVSHAAPRVQGVELGVVLAAAPGSTLAADREYGHCITGPAQAKHRAFMGAQVMLLIRPSGDPGASLEGLSAFLAARPTDEAIGALLWSDAGVQAIDIPTLDRARTEAQLARALASATPASQPVSSLPAEALTILRSLAPHAEPWLRALVVWSPGEVGTLTGPVSKDGFGVSLHGLVLAAGDAKQRARALAAELTGVRERGYYGLAACAGKQAELRVGEQTHRVELDELAPELAQGDCDLERAQAPLAATARVEFTFSPAQRAVFDQRIRERDKTSFDLSVRWHDGLMPVTARAHIRGQSSLDCTRKSFAVDLESGAERPFLPGLSSDEFFLISMCLDEAYINQTTGDRLSRELGLFPFELKVLELVVDGKTQGIYLMLPEPSDGLERKVGSLLGSVIRRNIDIDDKPAELDFARDDETQALADYDQLVASLEALSGEALLAEARSRMDLDQFLRWIALMTLLRNGDYVDELFFYASDRASGESSVAPYFSVFGWDPDDLFSTCHHGGRFAIADPHGLLYCAEGLLEHRLLADPLVYAHYVDVLEQVLGHVTEQRFAATLEQSTHEALTMLARDDLRAACAELLASHPERATREGAEAFVRAAAAQMRKDFAAQRALLQQRITEYRAP